tara:strand:+ start:885 stop:1184 length:300 start_codon:yes stop_codon:yes gene_type:complete
MYRLIEIDGTITGYELHEEGTYTVEEAKNMVKYGTTTPTDEQIQELDDESATFRSNKDARRYLADTDWYITRNTETGAAIPSDITTKRQEARDRIQEIS